MKLYVPPIVEWLSSVRGGVNFRPSFLQNRGISAFPKQVKAFCHVTRSVYHAHGQQTVSMIDCERDASAVIPWDLNWAELH